LRLLLVPVIVLALVLPNIGICARAIDSPRYKLTVIGGRSTRAAGINNRGQIIFNDGAESCVWTPAITRGTKGTIMNLGDYWPWPIDQEFGIEIAVLGINDGGWIVGSSRQNQARGVSMAFCVPPNKVISAKSFVPNNWSVCAATAINDKGIVVGWEGGLQTSHPFIWSPTKKKLTRLGKLSKEDEGCHANDINNRSQIVGASGFIWQDERAFLWENNHFKDLGAGRANSINDHGVIVGTSQDVACKWVGGKKYALAFPENPKTEATDINNSGVIVGMFSQVLTMQYEYATPCIWIGGKGYDLNGLVDGIPDKCHLSGQAWINDHGQIAASIDGVIGNGWSHAVLLTPIP
jgi:probable HAF family extracellular repeat protein